MFTFDLFRRALPIVSRYLGICPGDFFNSESVTDVYLLACSRIRLIPIEFCTHVVGMSVHSSYLPRYSLRHVFMHQGVSDIYTGTCTSCIYYEQ